MTEQVALLKQLGLEEREAKVYLAALELGAATVLTLAKKTGIKRTTIYEFIGDMVTRGLLLSSATGKRKRYSAVSPKELKKLLERQQEALNKLLPDLVVMASKSPARPKIRFYEGLEGLKSIYDDTIAPGMENSEIWEYISYEAEYGLFPAARIKQQIARRVAKNISVHAITSEDIYSKAHIVENKKEMRQTIVLPKKEFDIYNTKMIYGNKIGMLSLGEEKIGIIIESKQLADMERQIFNLLWRSLTKQERLKRKR